MIVERQTYRDSRTGFDLIYNQLQKKYDDECLSKQVRDEGMKEICFSSIGICRM